MSDPNASSDEIVMVVASQEELALTEYERYGVYMCPAPYFKDDDGEFYEYAPEYKKELFWECSHFAFYGDNHIRPNVPKILARIESALLTKEGIESTYRTVWGTVARQLESLRDRASSRRNQCRATNFMLPLWRNFANCAPANDATASTFLRGF